jgi:hypothetical protein
MGSRTQWSGEDTGVRSQGRLEGAARRRKLAGKPVSHSLLGLDS